MGILQFPAKKPDHEAMLTEVTNRVVAMTHPLQNLVRELVHLDVENKHNLTPEQRELLVALNTKLFDLEHLLCGYGAPPVVSDPTDETIMQIRERLGFEKKVKP